MAKIPFPPGSRLAAYLRDSGANEQELSIPQQEEYLTGWCREHGFILTKIFKDFARSGSTIEKRTAFEDMIGHFHSGEAQEAGLVVWSSSRFARSQDDAPFYRSDLRRRGFEVYSLKDDIPEGPTGKVVEALIDWKNEQVLIDLKNDTRRGLHIVAKKHNAAYGVYPTGYRFKKEQIGEHRDGQPHIISKLEPDPKKAPLIRLAFEMRAKGASYREINAQIRLFRQDHQYNKLLNNTIYLGIRNYGDEEFAGFCEPLISQELWDKVQAVNKARAARHGYDHPRAVRSRFALSGILRCGLCGSPMNGTAVQRGKYPKYDYYRCQKRIGSLEACDSALIRKDEIDTRVWVVARTFFMTPSVVTQLYEKLIKITPNELPAYRTRLESAKNQKALVERNIKHVVEAIHEYGPSPALYEDLDKQEHELGMIREQILTLEANPPQALPDIEDITTQTSRIGNLMENSSEDKLGEIFRLAIETVTAIKPKGRGGDITGKVRFKFPSAASSFWFESDDLLTVSL